MVVKNYKVPTWAMCYFVNSDPEGLNNKEIAMCKKFLKRNNIATVGVPDEGNEAYFCSHNDVGGLACDVYDVDCLIND